MFLDILKYFFRLHSYYGLAMMCAMMGIDGVILYEKGCFLGCFW